MLGDSFAQVSHPRSDGVILLVVGAVALICNLTLIVPRGRRKENTAERRVYLWGWGVIGTALCIVLVVLGIVGTASGS